MAEIARFGVTQRYSDSVIHNGTIYLVEVPSNLDADITGQTQNLLDSVERQLSALGSDKTKILQATIYLPDMNHYDAMNLVWDAWLPAGCAPVRACIGARLANPKFLIEISLTAATK